MPSNPFGLLDLTFDVEGAEAPAAPAGYYPVWRLDVPTIGALPQRRFASVDLDDTADQYAGDLLTDAVFREDLPDTFYDIAEARRITVWIANPTGALDGYYTTGPASVYGSPVVLSHWDRYAQVQVAAYQLVIAGVALDTGRLGLTLASYDTAILEQEIPQRLVTIQNYNVNAKDLDHAETWAFGNPKRVPCRYINDDTVNNNYDYLIAARNVTPSAIYRDVPGGGWEQIDPLEYTVSTSQYNERTTVRFLARQLNFNGGFHTLVADVTGLQPERNFARAIRTILSDTLWGLGQAVDTASFDLAEAKLNAIGSLFCDGALTTRRKAGDVLRELCMVRGIRLAVNSSGQWAIAVDDVAQAVSFEAHDGPGDGPRTIVAMGERKRPEASDLVKMLYLRYWEEPSTGELRVRQQRVVSSRGRDLTLDNPWIRDAVTADKVTDYLAKRQRISAGDQVTITLSHEARALRAGALMTVTDAAHGFTGQTMEIRVLEKHINKVVAECWGWDASIYIWEAASPPNPAVGDPPTGIVNPRVFPVYVIKNVTPAVGTGALTTTVILQTGTFETGRIGPNSLIEITATGSCTGTAAARTFRLNGQVSGGVSRVLFSYTWDPAVAAGNVAIKLALRNQGSLTSQHYVVTGTVTNGTTVLQVANSLTFDLFDFTSGQTFSVWTTGQTDNAADDVTAETLIVGLTR